MSGGRHIYTYITPRLAEIKKALDEAGNAGITYRELCNRFNLTQSHMRDLLRALSSFGVARAIRKGPNSRWFCHDGKPLQPVEYEEAPEVKQIITPAGGWKAKVKEAQSWFPQ
jgi:hypothetical protein